MRNMGGGSQCNHSALSLAAGRKGKHHSPMKLQAWGNPPFLPKDMAGPVAEQHKTCNFSLSKQLVSCSPRGLATIAGLCGGFPSLHDLSLHTRRQRNPVKLGARMVFGPPTPDPPTI